LFIAAKNKYKILSFWGYLEWEQEKHFKEKTLRSKKSPETFARKPDKIS